MNKRVIVIQGHPDRNRNHFGHALAEAYREGAEQAGHHVDVVNIAELDFPLLGSEHAFNHEPPPEAIKPIQEKILQADHLVVIYPLWLGDMPALLKGFFEQTLRPGFAFEYQGKKGIPLKRLKGKSVRILITMGMPGWVYRWFYCAHSLKSLKRNILGFCGLAPIRHTLIGGIESLSGDQRQKKLKQAQELGHQAL